MRYLICLLAVVVVPLGAPAALAQPTEPAFEPVLSWVTDASKGVPVRSDAWQLPSGSGWIRTAELYSDFVLRLDFRVVEPGGEACVGIRLWTGDVRSQRGYCVALGDTVDERWSLGRIMSVGKGSGEVTFERAAVATARKGAGEWQSIEVRADHEVITVRLNGVLASQADRLSEFTGYLAMHGTRGRVDVRNVRVHRLPSSAHPFGQRAHRATDPGVQMPKPTHAPKPVYPAQPLGAWIQGTVKMELVVLPDGTVGEVQVVGSIHPDLDQAAIACARQWRFKPGLKDGQPAPVVVELHLSFKRTS